MRGIERQAAPQQVPGDIPSVCLNLVRWCWAGVVLGEAAWPDLGGPAAQAPKRNAKDWLECLHQRTFMAFP